jgi:hypothetical protein
MPRNKDAYFDSGLQGWLKTTAKAEHWRVAGWYTVDDLVQDGYICYCKCRDKYTLARPAPGERPDGYAHQDLCTDTPSSAQRKHFMALVQRAFYNHLYTLAVRYPATREQPLAMFSVENGEPLSMEELLPPQPEETSALIAVLYAPTEISEAIVKLVNDGIDGGKFLRSRLRRNNGRVTIGRRALRETTQQRMVRILGDSELYDKTLAYLLT